MFPKAILLLCCVPLFAVAQSHEQERRFDTWRLEAPALGRGFQASPGADDDPIPVGSLQKPFVAKAWATAHPGEVPPRVLCDASSGCWFRGGHGELDLVQALTVSCNTYFRHLAADTPRAALASTLAREGFSVQCLGREVDPDAISDLAIGLPGEEGPILIRPSALLDAYVQLVRSPWPSGEPVRTQVLAGLRQAALTGTAAALGQRGYWAKTGTVPSADGNPLHLSGFALAVDDSGWAILGRLVPGTGREAAARLAGPLEHLRPWSMASPAPHPHSIHPGAALARLAPQKLRAIAGTQDSSTRTVRVRLFDLLDARRLVIRNLEVDPVPMKNGYLGGGASVELHVGDWVGPGLLEIQALESGLLRRLQGRLRCERGRGGGKTLTAILTCREYVGGVVAAELPQASSPRRTELGAAVLRFLAKGPRHKDADVCDSTHCAWFIGRGPRLSWPTPNRAQYLQAQNSALLPGLTHEEWTDITERARRPGPSLWTSHCGGQPLPPHAIWGNGDMNAPACPRHGPTQTHPWVRDWKASDLARALGAKPERIEVADENGVWVLRITGPSGTRSLRYDAAHRLLASAMGWDALPSPADTVEPIQGGFRAQGVGLGHRVGLCLAD